MKSVKSLLRPFFDFSFTTFVTDRIIEIVYPLSIVCSALISLFLIVWGFSNSAGTGILMLLIGGPLFFIVSVIYARVLLEIIIVVFRISEHIAKLAERQGPSSPAAGSPEGADEARSGGFPME